MLKNLAFAVAFVTLVAASATAQSQSAREAAIKAAVPYASMLREFPTMTLDEYNAAVRHLATEEAARTPTLPSTTTSSRIGGTTFYNYDNGVTGTATRIGKSTYYNDSEGTRGTKNRIGSFDYYNFTSPSGNT